jgi:hypothetical protein
MPQHLAQVLLQNQIGPEPQCADWLLGLAPSFQSQWIAESLALLPSELAQQPEETDSLSAAIERLVMAAQGAESWVQASELARSLAEAEAREIRRRILMPSTSQEVEMPEKWKHWKPRLHTVANPLTMRQQEKRLAQQWADRLLKHFAPVAWDIPRMAQMLEHNRGPTTGGSQAASSAALPTHQAADSANTKGMVTTATLQEWRHLMGTARHSSIRNHCLSLERLLELDARLLPWTESSLRALLNTMRTKEFTPSQIQKGWKTIKWLSGVFGMLDPDSLQALQQKKEHLREELTQQLLPQSRRAKVPTVGNISALEKASTDMAATGADRYAAAVFRLMAGASARFNDIMHTQVSSRSEDASTIEYVAWQTKVTGVLTTQRPMPLIAPKHSFSGQAWWTTLTTTQTNFQKHESFQDMDYLLPTPTRDRQGFIPRPCSNAQALRWLRLILAHHTTAATSAGSTHVPHWSAEDITVAQTLTLPSLRVWMADLAYQAQVTRDQRRYIGRWAAESTADVYTREHRKVICDIWTTVCNHRNLSNLIPPGAEAPEDLMDDFYEMAETEPGDPGSDLQAATGAEDGDQTEPILSNWTMVTAQGAATPRKRTKTEAIIIHETPADKVPGDQGGPLTVVTNNRPTAGSQKVHLLSTEGKAIGCGWRPKSSQVTHLAATDYDPGHHAPCSCCFRHYTFPSDWQSLPPTGLSPTSSEASSDSNLSPDTASEKEALKV